ncbi:hypothetical protein EWI07_13495 [Sporolactobacillus sp. THM7-4]|nr:hypothetical protein EWI07_13495 [Sporolactobacillus sp. THM7-4]
MDDYSNRNMARRYKAYVNLFGTTYLHPRNPYIIGWWSAAFPGFGHLLLGEYLRGFLLFLWEVFINLNANLNTAMIYSFQGKIGQAKQALDTQWILICIPVYLFAIWDSYRATVELNKIYLLAKRENHPYKSFSIGAFEINYLDKRNPVMAVIWSLFMPGLGELYISRIVLAAFIFLWSAAFFYYSHFFQAVVLLFLGKIEQATSVLNSEWLLFLPSLYGFSTYDAYMNAIEGNKLFEDDLKNYLIREYQNPSFKIFKGNRVK